MGDQYTLAHGQTPRVLNTGQPIEPGVPFVFGKDGPTDEERTLIEQNLIMAVPVAPPETDAARKKREAEEKKAAAELAAATNTGGDR